MDLMRLLFKKRKIGPRNTRTCQNCSKFMTAVWITLRSTWLSMSKSKEFMTLEMSQQATNSIDWSRMMELGSNPGTFRLVPWPTVQLNLRTGLWYSPNMTRIWALLDSKDSAMCHSLTENRLSGGSNNMPKVSENNKSPLMMCCTTMKESWSRTLSCLKRSLLRLKKDNWTLLLINLMSKSCNNFWATTVNWLEITDLICTVTFSARSQQDQKMSTGKNMK